MAEWATQEPDFEERSANTTSGKRFYDLAEELRQRPGQWARYPGNYTRTREAARAIAAEINAGRRRTFPAKLFEARVDTANEIWVRAKLTFDHEEQ